MQQVRSSSRLTCADAVPGEHCKRRPLHKGGWLAASARPQCHHTCQALPSAGSHGFDSSGKAVSDRLKGHTKALRDVKLTDQHSERWDILGLGQAMVDFSAQLPDDSALAICDVPKSGRRYVQ